MRLDHLLSKEFTFALHRFLWCACSVPSVCSAFGLGGTSIKWRVAFAGGEYALLSWGWNGAGVGWRVVGTLLGCEAACVVFSPLGLLALWLVVFGCGGVVCQLHSGREHLVSNFLLQIVQ